MSQVAYFPTIRHLADYEIWCNHAAIESAAALSSDELFQSFPFGLKSIHRTLFHVLGVFDYWTGFIAPTQIDRWRGDYKAAMSIDDMRRWNDALSAAFLNAIDASHAAGLLDQDRRIVQLFHLVTHGTHHRTQFISMLRLLGKDSPFEAGDFGGWQRALGDHG